MQYSGIVVSTRAADVTDVARRLESCPGVEVYLRDEASGRIVVVHEAHGVETHETVLRQIGNLPGVLAAGLACHFLDTGGEAGSTLGRQGGSGETTA